MIFNVVAVLLVGLALVLQEFMPVIEIAHGARAPIAPVMFFAVALTVPFPVMLLCAFGLGLVWDARYLVSPSTHADRLATEVDWESLGITRFESDADLTLGYSILLFGLLGSLMQGVRPLFRRGRWELPVIMTGLLTMVWMLAEYLLINLLREGFVFPNEIWLKVVTASLLAMLLAPLMLLVLYNLAVWADYRIRYDGLGFRRYGI